MATSTEPKSSLPVGHTFDVDSRSGFMPPVPPIERLPVEWEVWEALLDAAADKKIQLGDKPGLTEAEASTSEAWRERVREAPVLSIANLHSPILLRRAHVVLAFLLHFYIQSLPPHAAASIPRSISLPLLRVSKLLDVPPLLIYADTGLFNWDFRVQPDCENPVPTIDNIRTQTMFTNLVHEEEFYLCASRIELRGVEILELMRQTMDETFVGDVIAVQRITGYLDTIGEVIKELKDLLLSVKTKCDPDIYYNEVRPWFRGEDSLENPRKWVYEGLEEDPDLRPPTELSGPSAGQSSMVHVIDIFLGVDHQATSPGRPSFMSRMQTYMPRNHRLFLDHLKMNPRPLRTFVMEANDENLLEAYNRTVLALKEFRDAHMIIATLYIIGPARRAQTSGDRSVERSKEQDNSLKGTGGTHLVKFLKDTRTRTSETLLA